MAKDKRWPTEQTTEAPAEVEVGDTEVDPTVKTEFVPFDPEAPDVTPAETEAPQATTAAPTSNVRVEQLDAKTVRTTNIGPARPVSANTSGITFGPPKLVEEIHSAGVSKTIRERF